MPLILRHRNGEQEEIPLPPEVVEALEDGTTRIVVQYSGWSPRGGCLSVTPHANTVMRGHHDKDSNLSLSVTLTRSIAPSLETLEADYLPYLPPRQRAKVGGAYA